MTQKRYLRDDTLGTCDACGVEGPKQIDWLNEKDINFTCHNCGFVDEREKITGEELRILWSMDGEDEV